jgi:hypothetical protein
MAKSKPTPKKPRVKPTHPPTTGDGDWGPAFLACLRNSANVRESCKKAKIDRPTAYRRKANDPDFARQWQDAMDDATDDLEKAARARAKKNSDTLLIFLLKCHRPEVYRDRMEFTRPPAPPPPPPTDAEVDDALSDEAALIAHGAWSPGPPAPPVGAPSLGHSGPPTATPTPPSDPPEDGTPLPPSDDSDASAAL